MTLPLRHRAAFSSLRLLIMDAIRSTLTATKRLDDLNMRVDKLTDRGDHQSDRIDGSITFTSCRVAAVSSPRSLLSSAALIGLISPSCLVGHTQGSQAPPVGSEMGTSRVI